jgi:hypothetical protein
MLSNVVSNIYNMIDALRVLPCYLARTFFKTRTNTHIYAQRQHTKAGIHKYMQTGRQHIGERTHAPTNVHGNTNMHKRTHTNERKCTLSHVQNLSNQREKQHVGFALLCCSLSFHLVVKLLGA